MSIPKKTVKDLSNGSRIAFFIFIGFIVVTLLGICNLVHNDSKKATINDSTKLVVDSTPVSQKDNLSGQEDMAYVISKSYVKDRLDSPEIANFPWTDYRCRYESGGVYFLQSYVKCKNLYGVELKKTYNCRLKFLGGSSSDNRQWKLMLIEFLN